MKTLSSLLAAGAILAFAAQAGTAANVRHAKHSIVYAAKAQKTADLYAQRQAKLSGTPCGYGDWCP